MQSFSPSPLPDAGRLAAIDFGTVRHGIAVCDPSQRWVTPLCTYQRRSEKLDREFLTHLTKSEGIVGIVLGLPIHCDGKESKKSEEVRRFAAWLDSFLDLPIAFQDERFSSAEARTLLRDTGLSGTKKKQRLDRLAAHLILNSYLESTRNRLSQNDALDDPGEYPQ